VLGVALLLLLPVLLLAAAVAIYSAELVTTRTDLERCADAAALAGVQVLVDDRVLLGRRADMLKLVTRAGQEAQNYAWANPVLGRSLDLLPNPQNSPNGDVVFALLDRPRDKTVVLANLTDPRNTQLHRINMVHVRVCLTGDHGQEVYLNNGPLLSRQANDVEARASAMLDRDVIGFHPRRERPLRLAPVALRSDPSGAQRDSWEYQVEMHGGTDQWRYDHKKKKFFAGSDGLFEMDVKLKLAPSSGNSARALPVAKAGSACLLQLGVGDVTGVARQLVQGVTRRDLAALGGDFVLGAGTNRLVVPGTPWGPQQGSSGLKALVQALARLQADGRPRIWPLCQGFDPKTQRPVISGFVAARVASVNPTQEPNALHFTLQPCMISQPEAVTNAARRGVGGVNIVNRYICRVRLVE
jgi:hypothetical protein